MPRAGSAHGGRKSVRGAQGRARQRGRARILRGADAARRPRAPGSTRRPSAPPRRAVWVGIGAAGTALLGIAIYGEPATLARLACIGLIVAGVPGLKLLHD